MEWIWSALTEAFFSLSLRFEAFRSSGEIDPSGFEVIHCSFSLSVDTIFSGRERRSRKKNKKKFPFFTNLWHGTISGEHFLPLKVHKVGRRFHSRESQIYILASRKKRKVFSASSSSSWLQRKREREKKHARFFHPSRNERGEPATDQPDPGRRVLLERAQKTCLSFSLSLSLSLFCFLTKL